MPGVPVVTVEETSRYRLEVPIEESRSRSLRLGQKLEVRIAGIEDAPMQGVVREIEPAADPASRTYLVKLDLPARSELRSGMYGEALLAGGSSEAVWIESRSIVRQGQIEGVYVVEQQRRSSAPGEARKRRRAIKWRFFQVCRTPRPMCWRQGLN